MDLIARLLLCLCLWTGPAAACVVDRLTTVPLEDAGPLMLVPVEVNGHPGRFILDTGAALSVVTPAAVERLGLDLDEWTATTLRGVGGVERRRNAIPRSLSLGGVALHRRALAADQTLRVATMAVPADGLLGRDFLFGFDLDLDPAGRTLSLYRATACTGRFLPWSGPYAAVPVTVAAGSAWWVPVELDGIRLRGLLDSGAGMSFLAAPGMARLSLTMEGLAADPALTVTGVGPRGVIARRHRFRSMTIGTAVTPDPDLTVAPVQLSPVSDLLLGADWIRRHRLWLSNATGQMFVADPAR